MKRYIDAEKLVHHLEDELKGCERPFGGRACGKSVAYGTELGLKMALSYAETLPTADVVEVVRCKECKFAKHCYGDVFDCTCPITPWASDEYGIFTNANDYCSYGERSENG